MYNVCWVCGVADSENKTNGGSILVVEDDEDVRSAIRALLVEHGYSVIEAHDGGEALRILFADGRPDVRLIISDLAMPRMSGSEMLQVLSSYSRSSRIPVVVVSVTRRPRNPMPHETVAAWLEKPFDLYRLLELVDARFLRRPATP